jgi:glutathione S-transferase
MSDSQSSASQPHYRLFWAPSGANMTPHAVLEDIGAPFELIRVDLDSGEHRRMPYLSLNPHGRVPTLIYDGDKVMYEAAAITLFLADRHPTSQLAPTPQSDDRGHYLQWMTYLTNTVQDALMNWGHPDYYARTSDAQRELATIAEQRTFEMLRFLDGYLESKGPFLCGRSIFACDYYLAMLARWTRSMVAPAHTFPRIRTLIHRVVERPRYGRMLAAEGIEQPL